MSLRGGARRARALVQHPIVILLSLIISIASFTIALQANSRATSEAEQRASTAQQQAEKQRLTFCGVFESIVEASKQPTPQPRTKFGESIVAGSTTVVSAQGLACTADPFDGR